MVGVRKVAIAELTNEVDGLASVPEPVEQRPTIAVLAGIAGAAHGDQIPERHDPQAAGPRVDRRVGAALEAAVGDVVAGGGRDVVAERGFQVSVVMQIVIGTEAVGIAAFTRAVGDIVRGPGVGLALKALARSP